MNTDRNGNPTDDADRMMGGCDTFDYDPSPDFDGMEYDDLFSGPRCGGPVFEGREQVGGCRGCRHCDPVDPENKPYGFGIERFEDPALSLANAAARAEADRLAPKYTSAWVETWGMSAGRWPHHKATEFDHEHRDFLWRCYSVQSARRLRHSEIVWNRLCGECETHGEAKAKYEAWARRAVTVRYRDERPAATPDVARATRLAA